MSRLSRGLFKSFWEREKNGYQHILLFAQSFHPSQTKPTRLTLSQTSPDFTCLQYTSFENPVRKGENAHNEQFVLSPEIFLPIWKTFCHFYQIRNCRLQTLSVWKSLKFFLFGKGLIHLIWRLYML